MKKNYCNLKGIIFDLDGTIDKHKKSINQNEVPVELGFEKISENKLF